jgi:dihydrofolate synthase/folylpolyglutamate synthase
MKPSEALYFIEELDKFGIDLGLDRVLACLEALDNPQKRYPCVHVAGTNGKGSTCALVAEILGCTGRTIGFYTSPPLERFGERIRVNGAELADEAVPGLLQRVLAAARTRPECEGMTQFELITIMGLLHFADVGVEAAVIEVGLGGRLDSTNVLEPVVTAVTNIGLEHSEHLGDTVEAVAREKAGIAKPGIPLITGASREALPTLEAEAKRLGAPLRVKGRDFSVTEASPSDGTLTYQGVRWRLEGLTLGLPGPFQRDNLAVALAIVEALDEAGWQIEPEPVRSGVAKARWPGRFENLRKEESGPVAIIDGAHNPHAARALSAALKEQNERLGGRLLLVLAILGDKDARSIVEHLLPLADHLYLTRSTSQRALAPEELQQASQELEQATVCPTLTQAWHRAQEEANPADRILLTGSLTLVGEARALLRSEGWPV